MQIKILGTGYATATKCYNTCFTIDNGKEYLLVDAGGGNQILGILEKMNIPLTQIHDIFVSHAHTDHVFGVIWVIRMIGQMMNQGKYEGNLRIYCHEELKEVILNICHMVLAKKVVSLIGSKIILENIRPGDRVAVLNTNLEVFDLQSTKMKQYGFSMEYMQGKKLIFCGDEPLPKYMEERARECDWMLHEAFCRYADKDIFKPYEKSHSTVKDACELAEKLGCKNLLLYHTEDKNITKRKELYSEEGNLYYHGNLLVPDDGEVIEL